MHRVESGIFVFHQIFKANFLWVMVCASVPLPTSRMDLVLIRLLKTVLAMPLPSFHSVTHHDDWT